MSLLKLLVLMSIFLTVNCQYPCPAPSKQHPAIPTYNDMQAIEVGHDVDQAGTIGRIDSYTISTPLTTIPIITSITSAIGSKIAFTAILIDSPFDTYFFKNDTVLFSNSLTGSFDQVTRFFGFSSNSVNVIAATRTLDTIVLIVTSTLNGTARNAVFGGIGPTGVFQLQSQSAWYSASDAPSGITAINDAYTHFAVFIRSFWTIITLNQLSQPIYLDFNLNSQIRLARTWVGCPVELCFEGDLDAASNLNGVISVYRGQYSWTLDNPQMQLKMHQVLMDRRAYYMQAAFHWSNEVNYIVNNQIIGKAKFLSASAPSIAQFPVGAAFVNSSNVILLSGNSYAIYQVVIDTLTQLSVGLLNQTWPGLPDDIDAAVEVAASNEVIFFKGSYHYTGKLNGGPVAPELTMNTLYKCDDTFYMNYTADINITTFDLFKQYIEKFKPKVLESGTTLKLSPIPAPQRDSLQIVLIAILVVLIILISITGTMLYVKSQKRKLIVPEVEVEEEIEKDNSIWH